MGWQTIVFVRLFIQYVIRSIILKKTAKTTSGMDMAEKNYWQFFFCFILSLLYLSFSANKFSTAMLGMAALGILNSWAAYYNWLAIEKSLVQASVTAIGDDLIALLLGYIYLGELALLTKSLVVLLVLAITACVIFMFQQPGKKIADKKFLTWVATFSVIWGFAFFCMRYYGLQKEVSSAQFLVGWYGGSWVGAFLMVKFKKSKISWNRCRAANRELIALTTSAWISIFLLLWALKIAPLTFVQPINLIGEMMLPCFVGLYVLKFIFPNDEKLHEQRHLSRQQKIILFIGFVTAIAIARVA